MLYEENPIGPVKGLMIYRDHANPSLFYYLSERPRLAMNEGVPEFVFLIYKRDITDNPDFDPETRQSLGGGFLAFTVDLGVEEKVLDQVRSELSRFSDGEVQLAPVQFRSGSVRLTITKDAADAEGAPPGQPRGMTFFEEVYGTTVPSLYGSNRATFGLVLSQEAALLFEASLRSGVSPVGVIYDLEYLALRPAFNVRISANYHRVYHELDLEFGARGQIKAVSLGVDVGAAFQRMRDQGIIKVEVTNFTDDDDMRRQAEEAFNWFKAELIKDFFKSSLPAPQIQQGNNSGGLLGQLTGLLGSQNNTQNGSPQPQRGTPTAEAPSRAAPPVAPASNVTSTADRNASAAQSGGVTIGNLSPFQVAFTLKYLDQVEDKERIFDYSMQAAEKRQAAPQGMFSTIVEGLDLEKSILHVNLDSEFFNRLAATVSMGGDLIAAGVNQVAVNLEYPGILKAGEEPSHVDGFLFDPQQLTPHTFTTWLNEKKDRSYRYQMDIHFKPDSPFIGKDAHLTTDWIATRDRQLTINPLDHAGLLDVEVSLGQVNPASVIQVQVEMIYEDPANEFDVQRTYALKPGDPSKRFQVRLSDRENRGYRYRVLYFLPDGTRYQTDWQPSEDLALVINEPFQNNIRTRLIPILDVDEILEAVANVTYEEQETGYNRRVQAVFSGSSLVGQDVIIPTLAKSPVGYSYEYTVVRQDGSVFETGLISVAADVDRVIISDGAGRLARIRARLPETDLDAANLVAIRVAVSSAGENPDIDEALFTPSQVADQVLTLVQAASNNGPIPYHYQITGYTRNGLPVPGASGETMESELVVPLPAV